MASKPSGSQNVIQTNAPPAYLQPYLVDAANQATSLYKQGGPQYYQGSTLAPQSQETQQSLDLASQRAQSGNSLTSQARNQIGSTIGGDYLYGGQGFNAALNAANAAAIPQIQSAYARSGRSGSGLAQTSIADAIGRNFAGLYGQERQNQLAATAAAPGIDYADINQLGQVGQQRDVRAQDLLNEDIQRFNFQQESPWANLSRYTSLLQGQPGGSSTTQTPLYQNRAAGALGGAATGAGIASALSLGGPWGWGLAGAGALTGLL